MLCLLALATPGLFTGTNDQRWKRHAALVPDPWAEARIGFKTDTSKTELERDVGALVNIIDDESAGNAVATALPGRLHSHKQHLKRHKHRHMTPSMLERSLFKNPTKCCECSRPTLKKPVKALSQCKTPNWVQAGAQVWCVRADQCRVGRSGLMGAAREVYWRKNTRDRQDRGHTPSLDGTSLYPPHPQLSK